MFVQMAQERLMARGQSLEILEAYLLKHAGMFTKKIDRGKTEKSPRWSHPKVPNPRILDEYFCRMESSNSTSTTSANEMGRFASHHS